MLLKLKKVVSKSFDFGQIEKEHYIVQGYTVANNDFVVTAYSKLSSLKRKLGFKERNSRVYIFDCSTGLLTGIITLNHHAHVGGVAYDDLHDALYVTGARGKVHTYSYRLLKNTMVKNKRTSLFELNLSSIDISSLVISNGGINIRKKDALNSIVSAATICYFDQTLYVATCSEVGSLVAYSLEYSSDGREVKAKPKVIFHSLPAAIQGIAIYEQDSKRYLILSQSCGGCVSAIKKYEFSDGILTFVGQEVVDIPGMEGIFVDSFGNITAVFEHSLTTSYVTHVDKLVEDIDFALEGKFIAGGIRNQRRVENNTKNREK